MVSMITYNLTEEGKANLVLAAMSNDTLPTETFGVFTIAHGSKCLLIDSSTEMRYDEDDKAWLAQT